MVSIPVSHLFLSMNFGEFDDKQSINYVSTYPDIFESFVSCSTSIKKWMSLLWQVQSTLNTTQLIRNCPTTKILTRFAASMVHGIKYFYELCYLHIFYLDDDFVHHNKQDDFIAITILEPLFLNIMKPLLTSLYY